MAVLLDAVVSQAYFSTTNSEKPKKTILSSKSNVEVALIISRTSVSVPDEDDARAVTATAHQPQYILIGLGQSVVGKM